MMTVIKTRVNKLNDIMSSTVMSTVAMLSVVVPSVVAPNVVAPSTLLHNSLARKLLSERHLFEVRSGISDRHILQNFMIILWAGLKNSYFILKIKHL